MAIVTFISDFGSTDHYVASVKASILMGNPGIQIIDISHEIAVGDLGHAAYVLEAVYRDFPEGSVHLIGISNVNIKSPKLVAVKLENHFFVGEDCGLYSLISDQTPMAIVDLGTNSTNNSFDVKKILAPAAAKLASGVDIQNLGPRLDELERFTPSRAKATKEKISGNIVRVDHYGNLVTNISKQDFDSIIKINKGCPYEVNFRREKITKLHCHYSEVSPGECFVMFNSSGRLQIGILQGHGADLLGLGVNDQVFIEFNRS